MIVFPNITEQLSMLNPGRLNIQTSKVCQDFLIFFGRIAFGLDMEWEDRRWVRFFYSSIFELDLGRASTVGSLRNFSYSPLERDQVMLPTSIVYAALCSRI